MPKRRAGFPYGNQEWKRWATRAVRGDLEPSLFNLGKKKPGLEAGFDLLQWMRAMRPKVFHRR
jgi:hypothetical protein